jgi:hypothetical protein
MWMGVWCLPGAAKARGRQGMPRQGLRVARRQACTRADGQEESCYLGAPWAGVLASSCVPWSPPVSRVLLLSSVPLHLVATRLQASSRQRDHCLKRQRPCRWQQLYSTHVQAALSDSGTRSHMSTPRSWLYLQFELIKGLRRKGDSRRFKAWHGTGSGQEACSPAAVRKLVRL